MEMFPDQVLVIFDQVAKIVQDPTGNFFCFAGGLEFFFHVRDGHGIRRVSLQKTDDLVFDQDPNLFAGEVDAFL